MDVEKIKEEFVTWLKERDIRVNIKYEKN